MKQLAVTLLALLALLLVAADAQAIKKCKDENGKWHYGDFAERECARSKVTTLDDRGFITETVEAPRTEEEQRLHDEQMAREKAALEQKKAIQAQKDRILSIYETEADIDRQLENQLTSVDSNIAVHKTYLSQMDKRISHIENKIGGAKPVQKKKLEQELTYSKAQVTEFSQELKKLEVQRQEIVDMFAREKQLYKELTKQQ